MPSRLRGRKSIDFSFGTIAVDHDWLVSPHRHYQRYEAKTAAVPGFGDICRRCDAEIEPLANANVSQNKLQGIGSR